MLNPSWDVHIRGDIKNLKKEKNTGTYYVTIKIKKLNTLHIYKNKDGNPSTKSTKHVEANVNT
jgi:hypothetical protein